MIVFYFKSGEKKAKISQSEMISFEGFQQPISFSNLLNETTKTKQRSTIYWNPDVVLGSKNNKTFTTEILLNPRPTTYKILVEGLANDGSVVRFLKVFNLIQN